LADREAAMWRASHCQIGLTAIEVRLRSRGVRGGAPCGCRGRSDMRLISTFAIALALAVMGCLEPVGGVPAGEENTSTVTSNSECERTGDCSWWNCFPSYTLCQDGACQGIGGCCTPENQE